MKVIIQKKFITTMGLIIQVKNDRIFRLHEVIDTEDGKYRIDKIMFSTKPDKDELVNLLVSNSA